MFDILIPEETVTQVAPDADTLKTLITAGVKAGNIKTVRSCVQYVNGLVEPDVNGSMVRGHFNAITKEAHAMNSKADQMARNGSTAAEIEAGLTGEYFSYTDIAEFKADQYGSVGDWITAMQTTNEEVI